MLHINLKKLTLPLCVCALSVLFTPSVVFAEETGPIAASKAADQRAALAKKAAEREARKGGRRRKKRLKHKYLLMEQKSSERHLPVETPKE